MRIIPRLAHRAKSKIQRVPEILWSVTKRCIFSAARCIFYVNGFSTKVDISREPFYNRLKLTDESQVKDDGRDEAWLFDLDAESQVEPVA